MVRACIAICNFNRHPRQIRKVDGWTGIRAHFAISLHFYLFIYLPLIELRMKKAWHEAVRSLDENFKGLQPRDLTRIGEKIEDITVRVVILAIVEILLLKGQLILRLIVRSPSEARFKNNPGWCKELFVPFILLSLLKCRYLKTYHYSFHWENNFNENLV